MRGTMETNNILLIISFLISDFILVNLNTGVNLISDYIHIIIQNIIKGDSFLEMSFIKPDLTLKILYKLILVWGGFSSVRIVSPWRSPWNRKN